MARFLWGGYNLFGQTEPAAPVECDCSTYPLNGLTQVNFDRSVNREGGYPATTSDCFNIVIASIHNQPCNNLYSITFDFSQVPPCFKKVFKFLIMYYLNNFTVKLIIIIG